MIGEELRRGDKRSEGSETILLVDDEKNILDVTQDMLGHFGYTSIAAESGERALEIFRIEKERIDLVILDLSMPGMGGDRCLEELLKIDPEIKIIITSGHPSHRKEREMLKSGAISFISKPFSLTDILKEVREVLEKGSKTMRSSHEIHETY